MFIDSDQNFCLIHPAAMVSVATGVGVYTTMKKVTNEALEATRRLVLNVESFNYGAKIASDTLSRWYITNSPITNVAEFSSTIKLCVNKLDHSISDLAVNLPLCLSVSCAYETYISFSREFSGESNSRFFVIDLMEGFLRGSLLGVITGVSAASLGSSSRILACLGGSCAGAVAGISGVFVGKGLGFLSLQIKNYSQTFFKNHQLSLCNKSV